MVIVGWDNADSVAPVLDLWVVVNDEFVKTCQWRCLDVTVFSSQRGVSCRKTEFFLDFDRFSYVKGIFLGFW